MKIKIDFDTMTPAEHPDRPANVEHLAQIGQTQEGAAAVGVLRLLACVLPAEEFKELVDFGGLMIQARMESVLKATNRVQLERMN